MAEKYEDKVAFLGVSNRDTIDDGRAYARELEVPYPLAHAPEVWKLFDILARPTTILFDARGGIAQEIAGPITAKRMGPLIEAELKAR